MVTARPDVRRRHQEQREQTRRRILDVARALLEERPWAEISIDDVTKGADLTRTAFYRHFPDQQALLLALLEDVGLELGAVANPWEAHEGEDPVGAARGTLRDLTQIFYEHGRLLRAIADEATRNRQVADLYYGELGGRLITSSAERIAADVAAGRSTVEDVEEVAAALIWMNERYLQSRFGRPPIADPERAAKALAEVWIRTVYG